MIPGSAEQKEISDADEPLATSPPLELRRPASGPLRSTSAVPHSLQSPQDRATGKTIKCICCVTICLTFCIVSIYLDSPQVAQVYVHGSRHPIYDAAGRQIIPASAVAAAEPPPAHRPVSSVTYASTAPPVGVPTTPGGNMIISQQLPPGQQQQQQHQMQPHVLPPSSVAIPAHMHPNKVQLELHRERELMHKREREKELRSSIPGTFVETSQTV